MTTREIPRQDSVLGPVYLKVMFDQPRMTQNNRNVRGMVDQERDLVMVTRDGEAQGSS